MTLAAAVARIDTWTMTGLTVNLGFKKSVPIPTERLPALVLELVDPFGFPEYFESVNVGATVGVATVYVEHKLLIDGWRQGLPDDAEDSLVAWIDKYLEAAANDLTLNGNLIEPMRFIVRPGRKIAHLANEYLGVSFLHVWELKVT